MMFRDTTQSVAHLKPDLAADSRIDLVEHERRNLVCPRENCLERKHHARELAAGGNTSEWTAVVSHIERNPELNILSATLVTLGFRQENHGEPASRHAQFRKQCVHCLREFSRRRN